MRLRIAVVVDAEVVHPADPQMRRRVRFADMMHLHIVHALRELGYDAFVVPFIDAVDAVIDDLRDFAPDLVFNLTIHARGDRRAAAAVAAMLELLGIPFTGAGSNGIFLACDKALSKLVVREQGVPVPRFVVCDGGPARPSGLRFPVIAKPRFGGGSEGIHARSLVHGEPALQRRIRALHNGWRQPVVCEEYIEGRDVTIGIIGNERLQFTAIRERVYGHAGPKFATFRVKRDEQYRATWGIHWEFADLPRRVEWALRDAAAASFRALELRDIARFDFRLRADGTFAFLEANHLPELSPKSFFGITGAKAGVSFNEIIRKIVRLARSR